MKVKLVQKAPTKLYQEMAMMGMVQKTGYDGSKGWASSPMGMQDLEGDQLELRTGDGLGHAPDIAASQRMLVQHDANWAALAGDAGLFHGTDAGFSAGFQGTHPAKSLGEQDAQTQT